MFDLTSTQRKATVCSPNKHLFSRGKQLNSNSYIFNIGENLSVLVFKPLMATKTDHSEAFVVSNLDFVAQPEASRVVAGGA